MGECRGGGAGPGAAAGGRGVTPLLSEGHAVERVTWSPDAHRAGSGRRVASTDGERARGSLPESRLALSRLPPGDGSSGPSPCFFSAAVMGT